jgi:hypothetical protein
MVNNKNNNMSNNIKPGPPGAKLQRKKDIAATAQWWDRQRVAVAAAIDVAEASTGHQILVSVGPLGKDKDKAADRVAKKYKAATLVICIDPAQRLFELRWADSEATLAVEVLSDVTDLIRDEQVAKAITLLASCLCTQGAISELPDIVEN